MSRSPQPSQKGWREVSIIRTAVFRLCGHDSIGPSGVRDQSISRINLPISPPPVSQSRGNFFFALSGFLFMGKFSVTPAPGGHAEVARPGIWRERKTSPPCEFCFYRQLSNFARHLRMDLNLSALEPTPQFVTTVPWCDIRPSRQNKLNDVGDFSDKCQIPGGPSFAKPTRDFRSPPRAAAIRFVHEGKRRRKIGRKVL